MLDVYNTLVPYLIAILSNVTVNSDMEYIHTMCIGKSKGGVAIVSVNNRCNIKIYDVISGKNVMNVDGTILFSEYQRLTNLIGEITVRRRLIEHAMFCSNKSILAVGGISGEILFIDIETLQVTLKLKMPSSITAIGPFNSTNADKLLIGCSDNNLYEYNAISKSVKSVLKANEPIKSIDKYGDMILINTIDYKSSLYCKLTNKYLFIHKNSMSAAFSGSSRIIVCQKSNYGTGMTIVYNYRNNKHENNYSSIFINGCNKVVCDSFFWSIDTMACISRNSFIISYGDGRKVIYHDDIDGDQCVMASGIGIIAYTKDDCIYIINAPTGNVISVIKNE